MAKTKDKNVRGVTNDPTSFPSIRAVLRYPFQGPDWGNRLLVAGALLLGGFIVPLVPLVFLYGYQIRIMRNTIAGKEPELPAWENWGELGRDGLRLFLVGLVYLFPAMAVFLVGFGLYCGVIFALPLAAGSGPTAPGDELIFPVLFLAALAVFVASISLGSLLAILGAIPLPIASASLAAHANLRPAFSIREHFRYLAANPYGYLTAWLITAGLGALQYVLLTVIYTTLVLICLIPIVLVPMSLYVLLVSAALFGQVYRESAAVLYGGPSPS